MPAIMGRRAILSIADAGISSAGNLAISIIAARTLNTNEFGLFAAMLAGLILLSGACRSGLVDAFTLKWSASADPEKLATARRVIGASIALGLSICSVGLLSTLLLLILGVSSYPIVLACALATPMLAVQECYRWTCYVLGRYEVALANTVTWSVLSCAGAALLLVGVAGQTSAVELVIVWAGTAAIAATVARFLSGVRPSRKGSWAWFGEARYIGVRSVADFVLTLGLSNGTVVLVSFVAGTTVTAVLRIAQIPMAAIQVLIVAMVALLQPVMVRRVNADDFRGAFRLSMKALICIAILTLAFAASVQVVPDRYIEAVLGSEWPQAKELILLVSIGLLGSAVSGCIGPLVRASGGLNFELASKAIVIPGTLVLIAVMAISGQRAADAALGQAIGAVAMGIIIFLKCVQLGRLPAASRMGTYK